MYEYTNKEVTGLTEFGNTAETQQLTEGGDHIMQRNISFFWVNKC